MNFESYNYLLHYYFVKKNTHACNYYNYSYTNFLHYFKANEYCAEVKTWVESWDDGSWNNIDCAAQRGYVCQIYKGNYLCD